MLKNTLEQFTPETENIIQWVNAFNYEEELNKINKYDNIKITKSGIKISDFFEAVETAPKQQEKNKKCVEVAPINNNVKLPLKFVWKHDRLQNFNNDDTKQEYIYFSKQVITPNNKLSFNFCEIKKESLNEFINDYLSSDNNLFEIIRPFNKVKLFFDLEYKLNEISINYKDVAAEKLNNTIQFIRIQADNILKINITNDDFIILDSCTPEKISFHLIINKIVFESLGAQKIFIQYLLNILYNDTYFYNKINNFIDSSVYEKNRNMRLINQSKINKNTILKNNDVKIYDTLINIHEDIKNYIKLDDIKHLENIKIITTKPKEKKPKENKTNKNTNDNLNIYCPKFETLPKLNLKMIKNINDDDLKKLPYWKQYLYLINQPLKWEEYFKISCALARCENVTVDDFKEWAKLHPEYNDQDPEIINFDKKKSYKNEKGYNIFTLRKLAKICNPDFFKHNPDELNKILTDLNLDGYNVIIEETKYIDESGEIAFNSEKFKFTLILAPMGKGKTQFITRYLFLHNSKSILFISTRKTFADFVCQNDFKKIGLVNYQDFKGNNKDITKHNKIVCSLESLQDIKSFEKFDIVVLDESETIMNQLDSTTMDGKTLNNYLLLKSYIDKAEKVFVADAFISNRTLTFVNSFIGNRELIINEKPIINREATEINEDDIFNVLVNSIKKGENNYCCFGSMRKQQIFFHQLIDQEILKKEEILYYNSSSDDNKASKTLKEINTEWIKYRLVLTTPTITVGCSFDKFHFHNTFIIGYPSCNVRDIFQTHMRARNLINNKLYFSIPEPRKYNFIKSQAKLLLSIYDNYDQELNYNYNLHMKLLDQYEKNIKNNKILYDHLKSKEKIRIQNYRESFIKNIVSDIPEELKEIKKYNLLERCMNGLYYKYMFFYYVKKCNYKLVDTEDIYDSYFDEEDDTYYKEIDYEIINEEQAKIIEQKIKEKKATEFDKNNLDKYYFYIFLNNKELDVDVFNKIYNNFWCEKYKRSMLKNTRNELFNRIEFLKITNDQYIDKENKTYTKGDVKNSKFKLQFINQLKEKLGIDYTFNNVNITREQINNCTEYLQNNREEIYNVFNIAQKDRGTADLNFTTTLKFINTLLNNWNSSTIRGDKENYNKSSKTYKSYILINDEFNYLLTNDNIIINELFKIEQDNEYNYEYIEIINDENIYNNYMFIDIE